MSLIREKIFLITGLFIFPGMMALSLSFRTPVGAYEPKIVGTWAEIWGREGWEANVDYVDTVVVELDLEGKFQMHCTNKPNYVYDKISFDGKHFNFRMENSSGDDDPFYVNYWMIMDKNPDELTGESKNTREDHNFVRLLRVK